MKKSTQNYQRTTKKSSQKFDMVHADAAGIDIGSDQHWICVPQDRDKKSIRKFGAFTCDLYAIAQWLKNCGINTVAMESTGIYWIPLFQVLESKGFEVFLVNAKHIKNVPGRTKTDRLDCEWIQKLHSFGLLSASFRPKEEICKIRSLLRHRDNLIQMTTKHIQHIQKSLHQMNIKLDKVISDVTGRTGLKIIESILKGERNPEKLANLKDNRIKASSEDIKKSLEGDYREEHLFTLQQSLEFYKFTQEQIMLCDNKIEKLLQNIDKKIDTRKSPLPPSSKPKRGKPQRNEPNYEGRRYLYEMTGVDLTEIPGLQSSTIQTIIAETGLDMHKWKTEKHFVSWLGLCPNDKISGGKKISSQTKRVKNRAALAFRRAASVLRTSKSYLGAFYRRIKSRTDSPKAITATARKLAIIFYQMIKNNTGYKDLGEHYYYEKYKEKMIKKLQYQAVHFGFSLVPKSS